MSLTKDELATIKATIGSSSRPFILFDDDPDGLCSFLQVYRYIGEGKGIPVKTGNIMNEDLAQSINDYSPDLVILLDIAVPRQDFIDAIRARVISIDHHPILDIKGLEIFNPRRNDPLDNRPTSYWIYRALGTDLWLAMVGMIGDWFMPEDEIRLEFIRLHPELLGENVKKPEEALHKTPLGVLVHILSLNLKGKTGDVIKSVKVATRINSPEEILEQQTSGGKFLYKKYARLKAIYDEVKKQVDVPKDKLLVFVYRAEMSFSSELSNELIYEHPDKVILVAWEYGGEYKCSMRSSKINLPSLLARSLEDINGYGGGHDHSVGACIKTEHFPQFVENLKKNLSSA